MWAWLLAAVWPLAKQVLLMLGIGWVTYEAYGLIVDQIAAQMVGYLGGLPSSVLQIASLLGVVEALGITLGALSARAALLAVGKLGKVTA